MREADLMSSSVLRFETTAGAHIFVVDGSQIYDLPTWVDVELRNALAIGDDAVASLPVVGGNADL